MVALALNTGLIPLTKRATTAKKTVRRTVAPKVRRSLLFLASTRTNERTNGWMDGCAQPLPVFFFNAVDARRRASSGSRFRVDPPSRRAADARPPSRRRRSARPVRVGARASAPARETRRRRRTDPRAIGRSVDRSIVPLGRCERTNDANERCERTNDANERRSALPRSIAPTRTHARTRGRTHGTVVVRSGRPNRITRRVRSPVSPVAGPDPW